MPAPQPPSERLDARSDAPLVIVARVALRIFSSHALRPAGAKGEACHSVDGALGGIQRSCVGIQGVSKRRHEASSGVMWRSHLPEESLTEITVVPRQL